MNTLLTNLTTVSGSGVQAGTSFGFDTSNAVTAATYPYAVTDSVNGPLTLVKLGSGTLVLTASNTYSGPTIVNGGALQVASSASLGNGGAILNAGILQIGSSASLGSGLVNFLGGTLQYGPGVTADVSAQFAPVASGQAATIDTNGNSMTFSSSISGAGGLTKDGNGILTLATTSSYTGPTVVNAGTLSLPTGGQIYSTASATSIKVNAGGLLQLAGWDFTGDPGHSEPPQSLGVTGFTNTILVVNGGTIEYIGGTNDGTPGNLYGGRPFTIGSSGATLEADNGPGTTWYLVLDNRAGGTFGLSSGGTGMLTLAGSGNGARWSKVIPGTGGVTKDAHGHVDPYGRNNTYTGGHDDPQRHSGVGGNGQALGVGTAGPLLISGGTLDLAGLARARSTGLALTLAGGSIVNSRARRQRR